MTPQENSRPERISAPIVAVGRGVLNYLDRATGRARNRADLTAVRGHSFLGSLSSESVVLDLGAHRGEFSSEVASRFGCACYAVEPVPSLHAQIPISQRVASLCAAVASHSGEAVLYLADNPEGNSLDADLAGVTRSIEVATFTLDDLLDRLGLERVSLAKLDIEGAETAVLLGAHASTLQKIEQLSVEFHDFLPGYSDNDRARAVFARLKSLGLASLSLSQGSGDRSDVLFFRPAMCRLTFRQRLAIGCLRTFLLPARGILESLRRRRLRSRLDRGRV